MLFVNAEVVWDMIRPKLCALSVKWMYKNLGGKTRRQRLEELIGDFYPADIFSEETIDCYAEIDAFSQNKLPAKPLGMTSRNMGKNDLWIAAVAHILGARLLTSDADFDHLGGGYLDLVKIKV
jgi:tRNA(fMet)-specific endonuclease VapC